MEARTRRIALLVVALSAAIISCLWFYFARSNSRPLTRREIATQVLAVHLRETIKPKAVLVISNPFSQMPGRPAEVYDFEQAGINGLKGGFGENVPLQIVYPRLRPEARQDPSSVYVDPDTKTPLSFLIAENAFEEVIAQNRDCDLIISLIGLPLNLPALQSWKTPGPPRFALLLPDWRMIGNPQSVREAFASGKLAAAVVAKSGAALEPGTVPGDSGALFDSNFVLVTATNIDQLIRSHPAWF